jgi:hypothetical protein
MSQTAQTGYIAIGVQTAKGTPATVDGSIALLTTSSNVSGQAELLDFEDEIGGGRDAESTAAVMGGFTVSGELEGLFRPTAIGYLLMAAGFTPAAPVAEAGATGAYTHTFTPSNTAVYLTILGRWGSTDAVRQFSDCLVDEFSISLDANGKATWTASIVGAVEEFGVAGVTPTFETSPVANYEGSAVTFDELGTYRWESIEFSVANNLSDDEFVIGSRTLDDVTFGAREVTLGGTVKVGNNTPSVTALYRAAVYGSKTATEPGNADPYHTSSVLTFGSRKFVGTSAAKRFGLTATMPDVVLGGFPLESSGAERLSASIEGRALKGAAPVVTIDLVNAKATAYAAA